MKTPKSYRFSQATIDLLELIKKRSTNKTETEIVEEAITKMFYETQKKQDELDKILTSHQNWVNGMGGERANLSYKDFIGLSFAGAELRKIEMEYADLEKTDLSFSKLKGGKLEGTNVAARKGSVD